MRNEFKSKAKVNDNNNKNSKLENTCDSCGFVPEKLNLLIRLAFALESSAHIRFFVRHCGMPHAFI